MKLDKHLEYKGASESLGHLDASSAVLELVLEEGHFLLHLQARNNVILVHPEYQLLNQLKAGSIKFLERVLLRIAQFDSQLKTVGRRFVLGVSEQTPAMGQSLL